MKVIVDNKIPFIKEAIGKIADEVIYVPGKDFTPALVKDAHALNATANYYKEAGYNSLLQPQSASII